jgi:hypothetical protein
MRDVARQEEQIVRRQLTRKCRDRGFIAGVHEPDLDLAHTERGPSHASSRGHSRLTAFGPATKLT